MSGNRSEFIGRWWALRCDGENGSDRDEPRQGGLPIFGRFFALPKIMKKP
jgi:hypothetical protein